MTNMRRFALAALTALLLSACGGGDPDVPGSKGPSGAPTTKGAFTAVVSFGTSASDVGTYGPVTSLTNDGQPPYFGGKFTTNGATGTVWVENLVAKLKLPTMPVITPAMIGWGTLKVECPVAAANEALAGTCTAYGQGGARVTDPNGVGHVDAQGNPAALTVPIVQQIDNHLARFKSFKETDLILVEGGLNDLFVQMSVFAATVAAITDTPGSDAYNQKLFEAQSAAQGAMKQAGLELAGYVRDKILANGGKYVAVATTPDLANTPFGNSPQVAPAKSVLTALSATFNLWLREGLAGQPVQIIDFFDVFNAGVADPAKYGFANVTAPACSVDRIKLITGGQIETGSSLFCNSTVGAPYFGLNDDADPMTWFFADDVHPTTGGHKLISDLVVEQFKAFGWI